MQTIGPLAKMSAQLDSENTAQYKLQLGDNDPVALNTLVGQKISLSFTKRIFCICGKKKLIKKSYQQGYCFPCTQTLARCDLCIVKPERCHHHLGTCREPSWGDAHCMIDHTFYLANSSGLKIGITRAHQRLTRWIDQGASQALPILRFATRRDSGLMEKELAKKYADKTNWRRLLAAAAPSLDLEKIKQDILADVPEGLEHGEREETGIIEIKYPVQRYPAKVNAANLDREPVLAGELLGIKGQYLIFDHAVINIRKYQGYEIALSC